MRNETHDRAAGWTRWAWAPGLLALLVGCAVPSAKAGTGKGPAEVSAPVVVLDAGPADAGFDAGHDAGVDAGPPFVLRRTGRFFEHPDRPIRTALANEEVAEVRRGHGGRSLSFRVTLADGTEGYFKPAQSFNGMRWSSEIAAFHLDRELGFGRVAPSVGRRIAWSELEAAAGEDGRVDELSLDDDEELVGAFIWWVPARLRPVELPEGWAAWLRLDETLPSVSPFQRPGAYRRATAEVSGRARVELEGEVPEPDRPERPAELSDIVVFDYLTQNTDRWGGHNTNLRTVGEGGELMFLDNAAGFVLRRERVPIMDRRLAEVQRFRRRTVEALRQLDVDRLQRRLEDDPLAPTLDETQLANLEARRQYVLDHVDALVERYGEERVYAW